MRLILAFCAVLGTALAESWEKEVTAAQVWTDSGIDVAPGDLLRFEAAGSLTYANSKQPSGPEGLARAWTDLIRTLPVNEAGRGALVGRLGASDAARGFLIGAQREYKAPLAARLYLGINQGGNERAEGSYKVKIDRVAAAPASDAAPSASAPAALLPQERLDSLPPRVVDQEGTQGDRLNFVIVGSESRVREALKTAGWVIVDRSNKDAVMRGIFASLSKQAYVTLPMSELLMFGRPQDFGYAQGDPLRVVAARHHFRIWKAPFDLGGQTVWAGAGTHDVGFDRDQRNNKITHKIDPETDKERDYIGRSLQESGLVVKLDYMTPKETVREAKTAHGQAFSSDGRTLIIYLKPDGGADLSARFGALFCSALKRNPDGGDWGACGDWIETPGREDVEPTTLSDKIRVLIVPGIFSSCAQDAPAFLEGQKHLKDRYGISVDLFQVANDSSEENAKKIAAHLREQIAKDPRKFIVVGYSKGTPDVQVALAKENTVPAVAAFVSVAGASGGSPVADVIPGQVDRWVKDYSFGKCEGDLSTGLKSLKRDVRQAFLQIYPNPFVPTYSLPAVSEPGNTSKSLAKMWEIVATFDRKNDGQLTRPDAIIPGSKYLGTARADHLAVALPFDKAADSPFTKGMDKARYPRAALLEAIVRLVVEDLEGAR